MDGRKIRTQVARLHLSMTKPAIFLQLTALGYNLALLLAYVQNPAKELVEYKIVRILYFIC